MRVRTIAAATLTLLFAFAPVAQADIPPADEITCLGDTASVGFNPGVGLLEARQSINGKADSAKCLPLNPEVEFERASVKMTGSSRASCLAPLSFNVRNETLSGTITWYATDGSTATSQFSAYAVDINGQGMVMQGRITSGYENGKKVDFSTEWNRQSLLAELLKCATFSFKSLKGDLMVLHVFP